MGFDKLVQLHNDEMKIREDEETTRADAHTAYSSAVIAAKPIIAAIMDDAHTALLRMRLRPSIPANLRIVNPAEQPGKICNMAGALAAIRFFPADSPNGIGSLRPHTLYIVSDSTNRVLCVAGTNTRLGSHDAFVVHDMITVDKIASDTFEATFKAAVEKAINAMRVLSD